MTTLKASNGVTLSAHATTNGDLLFPAIVGRGDFATRLGGRVRRRDRIARLRIKRAFLEG